ncbi:hypothetical protein DPMN_142260 [Dreissena polymorpha]|uniref:Uncharacterized protein n=1 Tax=Dreissena polymorpha TaxID=45954 RepID=A0A9D4GBH0_DREPO|nr:hypothetical protein DPMN_142260 [Dreissena polymorpha]
MQDEVRERDAVFGVLVVTGLRGLRCESAGFLIVEACVACHALTVYLMASRIVTERQTPAAPSVSSIVASSARSMNLL